MGDLRRGVGVLMLAGLWVGCGAAHSDVSGPAPPNGCGTVDPCGGDLTGTWRVVGGCSDALYYDTVLTCPPNTPEVLVGLGYTGTLTFNSDLTYSTTSFVGPDPGSYSIPSSCLPAGITCAEIDSRCSGASTCTCLGIGADASAISGPGTYSASGSQLILSQANTAVGAPAYCVQGGFLHLEAYTMVTQSDGTETTVVTSDIVAQKQ